MPMFGSMPLGCQPPELTSSGRWSSPSSSTSSQWWRKGEGAGSGSIPLNKLVVAPGAAAVVLRLVPSALCCRGGGKSRYGIARLGFTSWCRALPDLSFRRRRCRPRIWRRASDVELEADDGDPEHSRRWFLEELRRQDGWPASSDDPSIFRPNGGQLLSSRPRSHRGGSAASRLESAVCNSRDLAGPSGSPPAPVMIHPSGSSFGPDRVFLFCFGVLFVRFRDLFVISSFLGVLFVRCAAHRFD